MLYQAIVVAKKGTSTRTSVMDRMDMRVIESEVKAAVERCNLVGVDLNSETARTMLVAERQLAELGVSCDLVERLIMLTERKQALLNQGTEIE